MSPGTNRVELRVTKAQIKAWRISAAAEGLSLSAWIRRNCCVRPETKKESR